MLPISVYFAGIYMPTLPFPSSTSSPLTPDRSHVEFTEGLGALHFSALRDDNVHVGHILTTVAGLGGLHLLDDVHAVDDFAEDDVLVVEEGSGNGGDEELGAVCVGTGILCWC